MAADPDDIGAIRAALRQRGGTAAWRSLEDLAGTPAFRRFLKAEYPSVADLAGPGLPGAGGIDRRRFFRVMAASLALAGLAGCDSPDDDQDGRTEEVPYVRDPAHVVPGTAVRYATATLTDGFANGVHVMSRDGRPIKIESNEAHPWTRGGTDVMGQASILGLYDPFRSQAVLQLGRTSDWDTLRAALIGPIAIARAQGGSGLRLLTGPITSPSLAAQVSAMRTAFPGMHWHSHEPISRAALRDGSRQAFGQSVETRWRFDQARVVVALDGDFLDPGPQQVGVSRDWVQARRASGAGGQLLTLHSFSPTPTLTSAKADFHAPMSSHEIAALADCLATGGDWTGSAAPAVRRAIAALEQARGHGILLAGATQPAEVQEAVHRANARLGNLGGPVFHTQSPLVQGEDLPSLVSAMRAGQVQVLLMLGSNPIYDAPADLDFAGALSQVRLKLHAGEYVDETAASSDWHLPLAHPLEAWGDARAFDGTVSLLQPAIAPFYQGRSPQEILSLLTDPEPQAGFALLQAYWSGQWGAVPDAADRWHDALRTGFVAGSAFPPVPVSIVAAASTAGAVSPPGAGRLELLFRVDPNVRDGASANNAWLQELPKPLTKIVWDNVVSVSPRLAEREGLGNGDLVVLSAGGRQVEAPVWITPGQAENSLTVTLGYGRRALDMLSTGIGYDATLLRGHDTPWARSDVTLAKTGRRATLATTQDHASMEGHSFVRMQQPGDRQHDEASARPATLYASDSVERPTDGRAWGMVIDLDSCIGCNACVVACQSENNIAVVGKEQVMQGREMHWLRIDRYYAGDDLDAPDTRFMPVPCMHCEDAPCEVGCPVEATLHDHEGLNLMVYNRCVGTRACSGYCPYKVRHFNYLDYSAGASPSFQAGRNPEVTVRAAGVMEKCTYCVQRIASARIDSDKTQQPIADGVVQTACQTSCPTRAISFGNLADPAAQVSAQRQDGRNYALLGELGVKPRTTYLAGLLPPGPATPDGSPA